VGPGGLGREGRCGDIGGRGQNHGLSGFGLGTSSRRQSRQRRGGRGPLCHVGIRRSRQSRRRRQEGFAMYRVGNVIGRFGPGAKPFIGKRRRRTGMRRRAGRRGHRGLAFHRSAGRGQGAGLRAWIRRIVSVRRRSIEWGFDCGRAMKAMKVLASHRSVPGRTGGRGGGRSRRRIERNTMRSHYRVGP